MVGRGKELFAGRKVPPQKCCETHPTGNHRVVSDASAQTGCNYKEVVCLAGTPALEKPDEKYGEDRGAN